MIFLKKTCFFVPIILLFLPFLAMAKFVDSTYLSGKLDRRLADYNEGYFVCNVIRHNATKDQSTFSKSYQTKIINNEFNINLPANCDLYYVTFSLLSKDGKKAYFDSGNGSETPFLLQTGDKLTMTLFDNRLIQFSGKGAERLSCQQNMYMLNHLPEGAANTVLELYNLGRYDESYNANYRFLKIQLQMSFSILESYEKRLPNNIISLLKADIIGKLYGDIFNTIKFTANLTSSEHIFAVKKYLNQLSEDFVIPDTSQAALNSISYTYALYLKERAKIAINAKETLVPSNNFSDVFNSINRQYSGNIRDKILLIAFVQSKSSHTNGFIDKALSVMNRGENKAMLQEFYRQISDVAYPFDLPDQNGKRYSLNDFKGKIIIADFWFRGCHGCTQMPAVLEPIYQKFKWSDKVVWLSINVDSKPNWWKEGLKSKQYTFHGELDLSTWDGNGLIHPFVKYYNYNSFPQLLIIDKNGKTLNAYPPDPRLDKGKFLTNLLQKLL